MRVNTDPAVVLAGAAVASGNRMLAKELLKHGAVVSIALLQSDDPTLQGADDVTVAAIMHDRIQRGALR